MLETGSNSGPNTSKIPLQTGSVCMLKPTHIFTNLSLTSSKDDPLLTSRCKKFAPEK